MVTLTDRSQLVDGGKVILQRQENVHFAGFQPTTLWSVCFAERAAGEDYIADNGDRVEVYNAYHTEYYLDTPDNRAMAMYAYAARVRNPMQPSPYAMALEHLGIPRE